MAHYESGVGSAVGRPGEGLGDCRNMDRQHITGGRRPARSNATALGPKATPPDRSTSTTEPMSVSSMSGEDNPMMGSRLVTPTATLPREF